MKLELIGTTALYVILGLINTLVMEVIYSNRSRSKNQDFLYWQISGREEFAKIFR